ncbi:hypothetical protein VIM7927_04470 [Vibrio mangrovi]|uniref:Uncharacterized protein n=1 Tax=Vibrio mangrovi TaxID=474394 RepID=A0A1Y6J1X8_9VIBR|nr:hypothetical protein VIM7927_04470 [Vibrio mangrovi]
MCQCQCSRTDKLRIQAKLRTGGIAQTTVDASGKLFVFCHLLRGLQVGAIFRFAVVADDIRLDRFQPFDERGHVHNQVFLNREVSQWFDFHAVRIIPQEAFTGQFRNTVDHYATGSADRHPAGPAIRQIFVQIVFHIRNRVEDRHGFIERHLKCL